MAVPQMISFILFLWNISPVQNCASTKLPKGNVLGCVFKGTRLPFDAAKNETIATGATCVVKTDVDVIRATCNGTDLELIKDIEEPRGHIRRKRGWWRRTARSIGNAIKGFVKAVVCVATFLCCLWCGRAGPIDRTPPGMTCGPPLIPVTAKPYEIYAYATWTEPTAHDETDGDIKPRRRSGRPPGSYFPEFDTKITYEAKDKSGNRAQCTITVRVKIVRCDPPKKVENGHFQCNPVTDFLNGAICRFGCYEGFDLNGGREVIRCQPNGQWSAQQPVCKPWKCSDLYSIHGAGYPVCTNGFNFRSICVYNCPPGFDMPPKVSKALVCDKTKSWRKFGEPKCVDVEAPTFSVCPSAVITGTDTGSNSTEVSWKQPQVRDNSDKGQVFLKQGVIPGTRLTIGTHTIQYGARDDAGNTAINDCTFKVIVREIRCSKLYPTPFLQINCPAGYRSGAQCSISCDPGKILIGSDNIECSRSTEGLFGVWNWRDRQQSVCKHGRTCVSLIPPKNGTVACDNWAGGLFCQIQCRNGTELPGDSLKKLYVCSENGTWTETPPRIKTCKKPRNQNVHHTFGIAAFYFFDGDCTDPATQRQIAINFIAVVKDSLFPEACHDSTKCNPPNVQIDCGKSDRKKRSVLGDDTTANILGLIMNIPVGVNDFVFSDSNYLDLIGNIRDILKENNYEIFGNISVTEKQFQSKGLEIHCPEGAVKSEQSLNCVDCPEGTYYASDSRSTECVACQKGFYQDKVSQRRCIRCPKGATTHSVGAVSQIECKDACPPGSVSQDGLLPCSLCEQGEYQPSYGQMSCAICSGSKSTLSFGSESVAECKEFDIEFLSEERSVVTVTLQENVTVEDFTLAFWFQSDLTNTSKLNAESSLTMTFSNKEGNMVWTWYNLAKVIQQDNMETDTNLKLSDSRWHYIILYTSPACDVAVTLDGAPLPLNASHGICNNITFNKLSISSEKDIGWSVSQFNVWQGKRNTDYKKRCFSAEVGDILSWKMFEEANNSGAYMQIPSQCDDYDNCISSPCLHGSCIDALGSFTCMCDKGYAGTQCDVNIDDCDTNICMSSATCVDGVAAYTCLCPAKYTGQYCEIQMVDGGWSDWGNWSECSTTCGDGEMTRRRLCNSPTPDNGGEDCAGEQYDFKNCNNSYCPVCPSIAVPLNGSLDCLNDTDNINCTVSCDDGFEFDIEPLPLYYCGPQTFHEWNFQTDENSERKLPTCVEIKLPDTLVVHYSAHYRDLYCANDALEEFAREEIDLAVKSMLSKVPCLVEQTCNLSYVDVIDCDGEGRQRRSTTTAGFSLEITKNPVQDDKNETLNDLEEAFQYIQDAADNGELTVEILDDEFELDGNLTEISGQVLCRPGETRVRFYCVPCGKGSYLYTDYCKPCPIGTYQGTEGQSSCTSCPAGKSTIGIWSTSIDECTVEEVRTFEDGLKVTAIIVGCVSVLVVVVIVLFAYRRYRSKKPKVAVTGNFDLASSPAAFQNRHHGNLGPANLKFDPRALRRVFIIQTTSEPTLDQDLSETETVFETSKEKETQSLQKRETSSETRKETEDRG